jgi:hypothetical protein
MHFKKIYSGNYGDDDDDDDNNNSKNDHHERPIMR